VEARGGGVHMRGAAQTTDVPGPTAQGVGCSRRALGRSLFGPARRTAEEVGVMGRPARRPAGAPV